MNPTPLPLTTLRLTRVQRQRTGRRDVRGGRGAGAERLHRAPDRRLRHGEHRLLRQPAVHRLPAQEPQRHRPDPLRRQQPADHRTPDQPAGASATATGQIVIPNMGPNRYAATVTPPVPTAGQTYQWVQTTTLEGGHDHDIWEQEGATGFDTEQTKGAELVPAVQFGFVRTQAVRLPARGAAPTGEVKGVAIAGLPYIGGQNGQTVPETGFAGAKSGGPIKQAVDRPVRPRGRRRADLRRTRRRRRQLRHQERAGRHLPALDLGRRPGLHPVELQRRREGRRGDRRRQQDDRRLVHARARHRLRRRQRQRQAGPR